MAIEIKCQCSRTLMVSEELAGLPTRCPNCGRRHLVPRFPAPHKEEPVKEEIKRAEPVAPKPMHCIDCGAVLVEGAKFCQGCGIRVKPGAEEIPKAVRVEKEIFPGPFGKQFVDANIVPDVPEAQPAGAPFNKPDRDCRFGNCGHRHKRHKKHEMNLTNDREEKQISKNADHVFIEIRGPKRKSGIIKAAKSLLFIGLFIAFVGYLSAIPVLDNPQMVSKESMHLAQGIFGLSLLFGLSSAFVAFLGIFHFGRARWWGIIGVILGAFILLGVVGGFCHNNGIFPDCKEKPQSDETEIILVDPNVEQPENGQIVIDEIDMFKLLENPEWQKKMEKRPVRPEPKQDKKHEAPKAPDFKQLPVEDF